MKNTFMETAKRQIFSLGSLASTFGIERVSHSEQLEIWLDANYSLTATQKELFDDIYKKAQDEGNYWNEEELKIEMIGFLFYLANINIPKQVTVFYERPLQAQVEGHLLKVIVDCLVARPLPFHEPATPYFFLQEYKKGRGESKDPEAQMLMAMLIAQELNQDNKPIYGSYLFGSRWRFCTLIGKNYCQSREYNADESADLLQIIFILRKLKELILNR
jgi:hypothetical protein